ncbi:ADP-ribosylglycohydrolase family protein [Actinophytocola sp.]|uniref:ADP-ribosylglycohydrolase family protein n=1 Tax=Actinophytocola sp. TaxID=1872138 RepID=UPI002ED45016
MTIDRRDLALDALFGLALGDALGSQFFVPANRTALEQRRLPPAPWQWTDDAEMACSVFVVLGQHGHVDQDALASSFAAHHDLDRGYGPAMNRMLRQVRQGGAWRELSRDLFDGQGSWGHGAAMRVAPVGAWFADDLHEAARQAALSAEVTHAHPEAVAGAVAVAVAAALAARPDPPPPRDFLDAVLHATPPGRVRHGVWATRGLAHVPSAKIAVHQLGNGRHTSAWDTVPYALWAAARNLTDYEPAIWTTASTGGDTTCAIVGGIVASHVGRAGLPASWQSACEPLPTWARADDAQPGDSTDMT